MNRKARKKNDDDDDDDSMILTHNMCLALWMNAIIAHN